MLATTTKPYNPNRKQSSDTNWDKTDLCSFLYDVNIHNIPKNDIDISGQDYTHATKREIVAEIIRTINATHYNSLSGIKDIINCNNNLLKTTESRNKSIAICNKKIKYFEAKINRIDFLLTKAANFLPAPPLLDFKTMEKAQKNLETTSCNDLTFTEDDFKDDITNNINQSLVELNLNNTNDTINNIIIPAEINNKIESYNDESADIKDHNIEPTQKPPKQLQPQLNQPSQISPTHISQFISQVKNPSAILREQNKPKKEPQLISPTKLHTIQDNIIITPPIKSNLVVNITTDEPTNEQSVVTLNIDENVLDKLISSEIDGNEQSVTTEAKLKPIISCAISRVSISEKKESQTKSQNYNHNKAQKKKKKKKKKKSNKNNNNKKKQKMKKQTKPKNIKQNLKQKENILNMTKINNVIRNYEFSNDQYQDFMNLRVFQRSGLSEYDYYQEIIGPITDEKIKEWSSVHHSN